ncbi:HPr family phosphocarrier protein [Microbispora hainanensis]|uniref:HPr family phosphocarrier protein n=1 Tax=Microbispora hainanensis TaxID=568844 RepID=A0A544Z1T4_9ACTN|nr:HPr family phosphocarrier protein [Microbispora hainanensis]
MSVSSDPTANPAGAAPAEASPPLATPPAVAKPAGATAVGAPPAGAAPAAVPSEVGADERTIVLSEDLHARPASALAQTAAAFTSALTLSYGSRTVDVRSVLSLMGLGATSGQSVTLRATGDDAAEALTALASVLGA